MRACGRTFNKWLPRYFECRLFGVKLLLFDVFCLLKLQKKLLFSDFLCKFATSIN